MNVLIKPKVSDVVSVFYFCEQENSFVIRSTKVRNYRKDLFIQSVVTALVLFQSFPWEY